MFFGEKGLLLLHIARKSDIIYIAVNDLSFPEAAPREARKEAGRLFPGPAI